MLKTVLLAIAVVVSSFIFLSMAQARNVSVVGYGSERSYCNANSGYFCFDNIKRRSQDNALRDARRACEFSQRGRSLTYTASYSTSCNPFNLPPNHDGTWVSCNTNARMQCEVNR